MDFDLLSACVFCAASLFGSGLQPLPGFSGELAASYSTFQRVSSDRSDRSDVTAKSVMAGLGFARFAKGDRGAGTPETELRLRFVFPNAHTESAEDDELPNRIVATGNGRYDDVSLVGRVAVAPHLSIEGGWAQRRLVTTELVDVGQPYFYFTEERQLTSENVVYRLGARYRGCEFELGAHGERVSVLGRVSTANTFMVARGNIPGLNLEGRWKQGRFGAGLTLQAAQGSMPIEASFAPAFEAVGTSARASMQAFRVDMSYAFSQVDVAMVLGYGRTRLPFVAVASLGNETRAYDGGYLLQSTSRDVDLEFAARVHLGAGLLISGFLRLSGGSEDVARTDSRLVGPGSTVAVDHRLYFPFLIGIAAQFNVGTGAGAENAPSSK
jgi:hypothetical protein